MSDILKNSSDLTTLLPRCAFSKGGLDIQDNALSKDDWRGIGIFLKNSRTVVNFWIGDWLLFGERKWGEMYVEAMEVTGMSYQALRNIKSVCSNVDPSRRKDMLKFSHHVQVAKLEDKAQDSFLEMAMNEKLGVRALRERIKGNKGNKGNGNGNADGNGSNSEPSMVGLNQSMVMALEAEIKRLKSAKVHCPSCDNVFMPHALMIPVEAST